MNEFVDFWVNYVNFSGRTTRRGYWMAYLFVVLISFAASILVGIAPNLSFLYYIWTLAVFLPSIAIMVRRLRDAGKHWAWIFISLIPILGIIILIVLLCQPSVGGHADFEHLKTMFRVNGGEFPKDENKALSFVHDGGMGGIKPGKSVFKVNVSADAIVIELYFFDLNSGDETRTLTIKRSEIKSIALVAGSKFLSDDGGANILALMDAGVSRIYEPNKSEPLYYQSQRKKIESSYFIMIDYLDAADVSSKGNRYNLSGFIDLSTTNREYAELLVSVFSEKSITKIVQL